MSFTLAPGILDEIVGDARRCYPREGCGLIVGRAGMGLRFIAMANTLGSATAYEMDPRQLIEALRSIRESGEELAAIYHSHPAGPTAPSRVDIERAYYPDAVVLIVSLERAESPAIGAFRIVEGRVRAVELRAIV